MNNIPLDQLGIDTTLWNSLRTCQQESVWQGLIYSRSPLIAGGEKSCLLSLPTGAGKTGVISLLAHFANQRRVLILCHRRAVCDQLEKDVGGRFFQKVGPDSPYPKRPVFDGVADVTKDGIYITTFQMLSKLDSDRIGELKTAFDLILIDEGHSEPSPVWRTLVRGSSAHKIVITATPYRNDLFQFDINPAASYIYTFAKAVEDRILAEPQFGVISETDTVQTVLDFLVANPDVKCIVKCKTLDRVEHFATLFEQHVATLAIHDRYTNDARDNRKISVPKNIAESQYKVLVHQHKLDEGIDIPAAKILILTYVLGSGRELVQTVGRVVRKFMDVEPKIFEFDHANNHSMWLSYRSFDTSLRVADGASKFLSSLNSAKLIERYLEAFPDYSYHDNRFVGKFDINAFDPDRALQIPTASICFLYAGVGFSLEQAIDALYWRATNQGELAKAFNSTHGALKIVLSVAFNKSRFLVNELFFEPSLEVTILRPLANGVIAIYDSRGRSHSFDDELKLGAPLPREKLLKVMTRGASMRPKEASTRAIGAARRRPEAMHIKGPNLDELGGQQQFAAYSMSTIKCDTLDALGKKSGSYYVGVGSGRISDQMDRHFNLFDLDEWLQMIDGCLASTQEVNSRVLNAFAKPVDPSEAFSMESIVFDFTDFEGQLHLQVDGNEFVLENDFIYYPCAGSFLLSENILQSEITVNVKMESPYFEFSSASHVVVLGEHEGLTIDELLSKALCKILFRNGITFSEGRFYELHLPTQDGFSIANSELSGVLVGMPELLRETLTEKGLVGGVIQTAGDEFFADSVFSIVDKLKNYCLPNPTLADIGPLFPFVSRPDFILCADMGTEPADFVISSPEKLIYVHIKCGSSTQRPQSSAGALAEVGSQAIKNLEMLISHDRNLKAANWTNLLGDWPEPNAIQRLSNRIRLFEGRRFDSATENFADALERLWHIVADRRRSPNVQKEIWIVAANSFSIADFETQMRLGAGGRSESLQAYQLLQGWLGAAANMDVALRVFASS